jgi:hypothetical protein
MKIHYLTPYSSSGNIGKAYNEAISDLPNDCYVCIRDGDTMFLAPDWGNQIEQIITDNPNYDLITCMTNRLGINDICVVGMFDEKDISKHIEVAQNRWETRGTEVLDFDIAPGMLMIFHKSLWLKHKFVEKSIIFDKQFSQSVLKSGGKIGVATGLYIFHLYRMWSDKPKSDTKHLLKSWKLK